MTSDPEELTQEPASELEQESEQKAQYSEGVDVEMAEEYSFTPPQQAEEMKLYL